jgi:hypothetical protein
MTEYYVPFYWLERYTDHVIVDAYNREEAIEKVKEAIKSNKIKLEDGEMNYSGIDDWDIYNHMVERATEADIKDAKESGKILKE